MLAIPITTLTLIVMIYVCTLSSCQFIVHTIKMVSFKKFHYHLPLTDVTVNNIQINNIQMLR